MGRWFGTNQPDSYGQRLAYVVLLGALSSFALVMSGWWGQGMIGLTHDYVRAGEDQVGLSDNSSVSRVLTMSIVGDVMLGRDVESVSKRHGGYAYPFQNMAWLLSSADILIGNLETPLVVGETVPTESMVFRADLEWASALAGAGFDILGLANNHMLNQGTDGMISTVVALDRAGIAHAGAGETGSASREPAYVTVRGFTIALLAYNDSDMVPDSYFATEQRAGTALMDVTTVVSDIAAARTQADWIIVFMHSGIEYAAKPNQRQTDFAHAAIDAGADMVIGHHPHVVQSAEVYQGKYIFYSLGNFIFDQMWSMDTRQGLMLQVDLVDGRLTDIGLVPIQIADYAQPRAMVPENDVRRLLDRLVIPYVQYSEGQWAVDMSIAIDS